MAWYDGLQENFGSLGDAVRKYLIPDFAGGGYTEEEEKVYRENLEYADKTPTSEILTGVNVEQGLLYLALGLLLFMVLKD